MKVVNLGTAEREYAACEMKRVLEAEISSLQPGSVVELQFNYTCLKFAMNIARIDDYESDVNEVLRKFVIDRDGWSLETQGIDIVVSSILNTVFPTY